jgi:hypothetical protein
MPSAAVDAAFQARLASQWTLSEIITGTEASDPPDANAFLVVQYPVVNSSKPVLGRTYFEEGAARLVLNVKSGFGLDTVLPWADTLAGIFREVKFGGVETFVPSAPIINDVSDDGNWLSLSVIVPYRFQFAG